MMLYKDHKDIPAEYRRAILDETLKKRVSKVPIQLCNDIITEYIRQEQESETLKNYQVEWIKNGKHSTVDVVGRQQCLVEIDRVLEYGENKDPRVFIAVRQAGRLIAGYANGEWVDIPPKDSPLKTLRRL